MKRKRPPMQPMILDEEGQVRFQKNKIVELLLEAARAGRRLDLNMLASMDVPRSDREQFAQLIGYSLNGFADLSYVSDRTYAKAQRKADKVKP